VRRDVAVVVQASWIAIRERRAEIAEQFYSRLFTLDPDLRRLFAIADMERQQRKFIDTLDLIVRFMDDPPALIREARRSGARHEGYGVRGRDYLTGGEALLWALERVLGEDFDGPVKEAWAEAWTELAHEMARGAQSVQTA
jgi:hemoglobin-like flavoprotein